MLSKDIIRNLLYKYVDDETILNVLGINKYFYSCSDNNFWINKILLKFPLTINDVNKNLNKNLYKTEKQKININPYKLYYFNLKNIIEKNRNSLYELSYYCRSDIIKIIFEHPYFSEKRKEIYDIFNYSTWSDRYSQFHCPVDKISKIGDLETLKYLRIHGINLHVSNEVALKTACNNGHLEVVKYLVGQEADIHSGFEFGLRTSSENGHLEVVKYLVEQGADIHALNDYALKWASRNEHLEVIKYLVEYDTIVKGNFELIKNECHQSINILV